MKLSNLALGRISTLDLSMQGELRRIPATGDEVLLVDRDGCMSAHFVDQSVDVSGVHPRDRQLLEQLASHSLPRIAWLVQHRDDRLLVQVHEFAGSFVWPEPVELGVDERILDELTRRVGAHSIERAIAWLRERMLLPSSMRGQVRVLVSGEPDATTPRGPAFRVHGESHVLDARIDEQGRLSITRIVEATHSRTRPRALRLALGSLSFVDATIAARVRADSGIAQLFADAEGYLALWNTYNELERETVLARARTYGHLHYIARERRSEGLRFTLAESSRGLATNFVGQTLEAAESLPRHLTDPNFAVADAMDERPEANYTGKLEREHAHERAIMLPPNEDAHPPESGYLFVSLHGDRTRLKRRTDAWTAIAEARNPMPQLGSLLEGRAVPIRRQLRIELMSRRVREVLPRPTERQREALEIALSTPDIALIQGPPGTGKTRVIAALQQRLAEVEEDLTIASFAGNTLLTSFQHDAVETVASATTVLGLPAIKIGRRANDDEVRDGVKAWCERTLAQLAGTLVQTPSSPLSDLLHTVRQRVIASLAAPRDAEELRTVARELAEVASPWLSPALARELAQHCHPPTCMASVDHEHEEALRRAEELHVQPEQFAESAPRSAHRLLRALERVSDFELSDADRTLLDEVIDWEPTHVDPDLCVRLTALRDQLLARLQPAVTNVDPDLVKLEVLLTRMVDELCERQRESAPAVAEAIIEWRRALEYDPDGVREMVQRYTMALAATCQQSVSKPMQEAKPEQGAQIGFRSVIVDEAARANPLDLMIPMARAQRRLILVGDHRQLPHLLEPAIEDELRSREGGMHDRLSQSLFHRLFEQLRAREAADGIRRVVTLDMQFRMHPALGRLVSECFYRPYGEGFDSKRVSAPEFAHTVQLANGRSLAGRVAAWIDVPQTAGREQRDSTSYVRPCEARRAAQEAAAMLREQATLSVGVITFYRGQRDELIAQLQREDLDEKQRGRLRVGTVDQFQGREFDVVLLSLTRSNRIEPRDELGQRKRYGFLQFDNRLCVALSRQRRLLIVVGDLSMTTSPDARTAIPALVRLRELCESELGEVIDG